MTYRAAVIGLGRMGSTFDDEIEQGGTLFLPYCHAPSYTAHERVDLVAGADPHPEQRQIFADRWGLGADHVYADYVEMLAAEKPDIVSICTTARVRHRILLDTAGRYTTQDSQASVDRAAWEGFLELLRKYRKRRPINGVLVAISALDFMTMDANQRHQHASAIKTRIRELDEFFGMGRY